MNVDSDSSFESPFRSIFSGGFFVVYVKVSFGGTISLDLDCFSTLIRVWNKSLAIFSCSFFRVYLRFSVPTPCRFTTNFGHLSRFQHLGQNNPIN